MDGYSVKEAATVLGVPKRRVWELIARGVLSGAPEGDGGMRVFLQPRPARPAPLSSEQEPRRGEEPRHTNGNGGNGGTRAEGSEGSPFREILTEFRSLTERYGQALLALGEARGEVAALRSRVELLEARLDLRLPGPRASSTVAWEMPGYGRPSPPEAEPPEAEPPVAEPEVEPEPEATSEPVVEPEVESAGLDSDVAEPLEASPFETAEFAADVGLEPPVVVPDESISLPEPEGEAAEVAAPRRRRGQRRSAAIAGFAEALARAQDPTLADLPGAREAGEALAALQAEVEARTATREGASDAGFAPASVEEAMAAAPEAQPEEEATLAESETAEELESATSSFVEPAAAVPAEELVAEEPPQAMEPPAYEPPPYVPEPEPESMLQAESEGEPMPGPQAGPEPEHDIATEVVTNVEAPSPAPEPAEPAPIPKDAAPSPYTTEVVEPDWFADGDFSWLEAAQAEAAQAEAAQAEAAQAEAAQAEEGVADQEATLAEAAPVESGEWDATLPEPVASAEPAVAPAPEGEAARFDDVVSAAAEADDHARMHADASSAAEAIQEAFEEAEPEPAPAEAYAAEPIPTAEAEAEPAIEATAEAEPEPAIEATAEAEAGPAAIEATADIEAESADAIQEAFEEAEPEPAAVEAYAAEPMATAAGEPEPAEFEATAAAEAEPAEVEATAEAEAEPEAPVETRAAVAWEPDEEAEPSAAAEAIQDAFEPPAPEPEGPISAPESIQAEGPPAVAASSESAFSPDEVAVFPVRQPEPDTSRVDTMRDATRDERPPEARAQQEAAAEEPPAEPHTRMAGTGGLAVEAVAPPVAEPEPPAAVPPIAQEEELMWLGDEFEAAGLEIATQGWRSEPEASVGPTHDAPSHEMSDSDLAQLAQDEGWEPDEVEAIRTLLGRATPAAPTPAAPTPVQPAQPAEPREAVELAQASVEPTEAQRSAAVPVDAARPDDVHPDDVHPMDEERAEGPVFEPVEAEPEPMPSTLEDAAPPATTESEASDFRPEATIAEPSEPGAQLSVEETIRRSLAARAERPAGAAEPEWLRRRRGPAANAYRRLRRLLPG
jgi:hypothetical protein